jgi:hypothetical protein
LEKYKKQTRLVCITEKTSQCGEYVVTMDDFDAAMSVVDEQCVVSIAIFGR